MRQILALAFGLVSLMPLGAFAQGKQDFTLVNRTGYQIDEVYVAPSNSNDWEDDVLGRDVLENGQRVDISFAAKTRACMYDVKVAYSDKTTAEWEKFDLCKVSKITIFYDRKGDKTWAEYE